MTLPQYYELCEYWREFPPEHETLAIITRVYTTWEPASGGKPITEAEHRKSLERRWKAGALNIKQMFELQSGGGIGAGGAPIPMALVGSNPPGIGPFPGIH